MDFFLKQVCKLIRMEGHERVKEGNSSRRKGWLLWEETTSIDFCYTIITKK